VPAPTITQLLPLAVQKPDNVEPEELDHTQDCCLLKLGDGTVLQFSKESVPDPPAVSFANDIPWLSGMWDNTSSYWTGQSCISIDNHLIAIIYWPQLYKYGKTSQWKGIKSRYIDWKVSISTCFFSSIDCGLTF
jgi:hypothetical protein